MVAERNSPKRKSSPKPKRTETPAKSSKAANEPTSRAARSSAAGRGSTQTERPARKSRATTTRKRAAKDPSGSRSRVKTTSKTAPDVSRQRTPIVALGASAGGLQAFEEFFANLSPESGLSFVVISHQDPTRATMLPELLAKSANIPVVVIADGQRPKPNQIHVAPPGSNVAVLGGVFTLMELKHERGAALPIDHLFRSLAEDQKDNATCIVLSGNGTDGTLGLRAIKAEAGLAIVQDPRSAKFTGMPESAIATGLADFVLPPADMPQQLLKYTRAPRLSRREGPVDADFDKALRKVLILVRGYTGHDFTAYKPTTVLRRIERRMSVHQIDSLQRYAQYLERNPQEADILFRELLISVTTFFRDPDAFDALKEHLSQRLFTSKSDGDTVRVWVPGCATGEEAYSVAIIIRECMAELQRHLGVQIFGTDLDAHAIETARSGLYPDGIAADVGPQRLERFFAREENKYRINKDVRQWLVFAPHNLIADPPFTKLDLITCRNLLIYLNADLQRQLLPHMHYALRPDGLLMLGSSETIGTFTELFEPIEKKWKIYVRRPASAAVPGLVDLTAAEPPALEAAPPATKDQPHIASMADTVGQLLLNHFAPPTVIVNDRGDIRHIHGRTGKYLEPASGRPVLNILKMARKGLEIELAAALRKAAKERTRITRRGVRVATNGDEEYVDLTVSQITKPESLSGLFLVAFQPVPPPSTAPATQHAPPSGKVSPMRIEELERELLNTKETLRGTIEESETTNEELKSMNEELQSTNEELQSTNEELETSKEEMQSLNEELQTVNAELQSKIDELSQANDDMANLLNSTEIATIFLDTDLRIQRFTKQARRLIKLIESDIGRSIGDLASTLQSDSIEREARTVLDTLAPLEEEVQTSTGDWFLMRIVPYRTSRNVIEGLVMTFVDIGEIITGRAAERAFRNAQAYAEGLAETMREPFAVLDAELRVVRANRGFCEQFRVDASDTEGRLLYDLGNKQWDIPDLRRMLQELLPKHLVITDFEVQHEFPTIGLRRMLINARRLERQEAGADLILVAFEDVTHKTPRAK